MPRGRGTQTPYDGPSKDDLADFRNELLGFVDELAAWPLAGGSIGQLVEEVTQKGYALRIAATMGGQGRAITLYVGENPLQVVSSDAADFEDKIRRLILAARKLPRRRG